MHLHTAPGAHWARDRTCHIMSYGGLQEIERQLVKAPLPLSPTQPMHEM